ncbi:PREDICTED: phosphatidylglycerol/phosphatidylinositol transfer protein-like isoform X2 [Amphimedon queenslandica]|uniref:MD-2-related lipid-recognition domain-containing protein n=1 Tax=Amphimedon queenslandica TaxID=400682 RepID=A0AAN0JNC9_AMPQE|nr:PREDICTED: phosphatidylglycerol/phosphatidylinositol transfer protein-like isoform X2 [Amphimedon queenslandica]|eukprot:XP_019858520.1 PREDICTED: phosphatidylglycerol/phosphatidylinositol transfer protein-like isoform X2 [Amphimedon queenslandica]
MGRLVEYILLLLSVVLVVSTLTGSANNYYNGSFKDCSVSEKFAELINGSITTNPLICGKAYYYQGSLNIKKTIQWGILHFTLTHPFKNYANITFMDEKFNLCDYIYDLFKVYCPMQPGTYHTDAVGLIPSILWPGRYYAKAAMYNKEGEEIMCISTELTVKKLE